jgi:hypothetical protein
MDIYVAKKGSDTGGNNNTGNNNPPTGELEG